MPPRCADREDDDKGWRILRTEEAVFECHPGATHIRYPYVYGRHQPIPCEWPIVRRILDGRPFIILPDGGLTLHHMGYAANVAHGMLLAVDRPENARGRIYNCADDEALTLRQRTEIIAAALGRPIEIVSMPWELAVPARPLVMQPLTTHRVLDTSRIRVELGYTDLVPAREALAITARELAATTAGARRHRGNGAAGSLRLRRRGPPARRLGKRTRGDAADRIQHGARLHDVLQRTRRAGALEPDLHRVDLACGSGLWVAIYGDTSLHVGRSLQACTSRHECRPTRT